MKTIITLALLTIAAPATAQNREDLHSYVISRMEYMQDDMKRIDAKEINVELKKAEWNEAIQARAEGVKDLRAEFRFEVIGVVEYDKDPLYSRIFVKPLFMDDVDENGYLYKEIPIEGTDATRRELASVHPINFYRKLSRREERLAQPGNILILSGRVTYRHQGIRDVGKTMTLDRQVSEHAYIGGWNYNVRELSNKVLGIYLKDWRVTFEENDE